MSTLPKEVLRDMIKGGNLKSADDLHSFLKGMFKDALQEMLEAELYMELEYDKGERKNKSGTKGQEFCPDFLHNSTAKKIKGTGSLIYRKNNQH
jgi:hypothetical protein